MVLLNCRHKILIIESHNDLGDVLVSKTKRMRIAAYRTGAAVDEKKDVPLLEMRTVNPERHQELFRPCSVRSYPPTPRWSSVLEVVRHTSNIRTFKR